MAKKSATCSSQAQRTGRGAMPSSPRPKRSRHRCPSQRCTKPASSRSPLPQSVPAVCVLARQHARRNLGTGSNWRCTSTFTGFTLKENSFPRWVSLRRVCVLHVQQKTSRDLLAVICVMCLCSALELRRASGSVKKLKETFPQTSARLPGWALHFR